MQFTVEEKKVIENISYVYSLNRKFFIMAEEYIDGLKFFVTPVLEHRDALDHLVRAFNLSLSGQESLEQLKNAHNHELRAFFDIADYICIKIRERIGADLKYLSIKSIQKNWKNFCDIRNKMVDLSVELADIRINRNLPIDSVPKYEKLLQSQLDYYINVYLKDIFPRLKGRKFV